MKNIKNKKLSLVISMFTLLLCLTTFGQGPGGRGQQRGGKPDASEIFSMLDTNNDQTIDKDEASKDRRGKISEDFDEIDSNGDELIDLDELEASLNNRKAPKRISPEKIIEQVDDNGDGTLNELELAAKEQSELSDNFSEIDTNQDGELDIEELEAFFASREGNKERGRKRE